MTSAAGEHLACEEDGISLSSRAVKIGKLSTIYLLGTITPRALQFFLLPVFTYYLVPAQMGIVSLAGRVMTPMAVFVQLGLWSALKMQYFRLEETLRPRLVRTVLWGQMVQGVAICTLLSVAGIWLAEVVLPNLPLSRGYVFGLWLMIVWACLFTALVQLAVGLTQLLERAGACVGLSFCQFLLQAGLGVAAVVGLGWKGFGRQGTIFLAFAVTAVVAFAVVWQYGKGTFEFSLFKRTVRTGLTFVPHSFSGYLMLALNIWLLNKMLSPAAVGVYGVAMMFPQLIQMPLISFGNAAYPTLAKLMSDGSEEAQRQQSRLYTLLIIGVVGLTLGTWLFSGIAIQILTAPAYHGATRIVLILIFAWLLQGLYLVVSQPVFYFGGGPWLSAASVSSTIICVVLSLILIPISGVFGAAWAMVGGFLVSFTVAAFASYHLYPLPWQVTAILRAIACGAALAVADLWLSPGMPFAWTIVFKTALLLVLIPALWVTGVVSTIDLRRAKNLVLRKVREWANR